MNCETKKQLENSYQHIKPYLNDSNCCGELHKMCQYCEAYYGEDHDYDNCKNMPCFRFYLAYEYLEWNNSSDGY